ncbi:cytochrome P450 [Pseudonocardia eucalypti]|uniref:Cytochrome P450 n=1 Tax=Pseudonocardia eucalypti TaxID=648755 RepID=A0ABP9QMT2_9PSEU|nr:cytochrome P450 [Pseudonocardia eucalypti]
MAAKPDALVDAGYGLAGSVFWAAPESERLDAFARLRAGEVTREFQIPRIPFLDDRNPGAWALVHHAEVVEASRRPDLFSSEPAANSVRDFPGYLDKYYGSMINMDDPGHSRNRAVVSRAFTPRVLAKTEVDLQLRASAIVDDIVSDGPGDFVTQVAARLPIEVICDMLGIPEEFREEIFPLTNRILGFNDPEYNGGISRFDNDTTMMDSLRFTRGLAGAGLRLFKLANRLAKERVKNPTDDVTSMLVAGQDEDNLTPQEFASFFLLLVVAGNETVRTALSHAVHLFTQHPDQLRVLRADFEGRIGGAIEEVIRFSTPVISFRRNVTRECNFHGRDLYPGNKVILFYNSANRDEKVFANPNRFDITRTPNPHVGYGGPGPHYCLGVHLARREMTVMLRELYTRLPDLHTTGEPDRLTSYLINGIKHMSYAY